MKFSETPSLKYREAASALRALLDEEGDDSVNRVFAEIASTERERLTTEGLNSSRANHVCYHRLAGLRCPGERCFSPNDLPVKDHSSEWKSDGGTKAIYAQPYGLSYSDIKQLINFCEKHGLQATVDAQSSWHFPGRTIAVRYERTT